MQRDHLLPFHGFYITIADGGLSLINAALCVMCLSWLSCRVCFVDVEAATESERDENLQSTGSSVTDDKKQQSPFTPCSPHDIRPLPKAGPQSGKGKRKAKVRGKPATDLC